MLALVEFFPQAMPHDNDSAHNSAPHGGHHKFGIDKSRRIQPTVLTLGHQIIRLMVVKKRTRTQVNDEALQNAMRHSCRVRVAFNGREYMLLFTDESPSTKHEDNTERYDFQQFCGDVP